MAKELENPFEGRVKNPDNVLFDEAREQWKAGLMSSDDFLPMALKKLYSSHHLFQNGDTMLRDLSPDTIQKALQSSEVLNGARLRGFSGEDPSPHMSELLTHYLYNFPGAINLSRFKVQQNNVKLAIDSWEFRALDPALNSSLPLHLYLGQKAGRPTGTGAESVYLSEYKNIVYDNVGDKKDATNILLWLHYKGLLSKIKRYEIDAILRVADQKEFQYPYNNFEELAMAVEPFAYFTGWRQRLEEANSEREFKLPQPFRNGMEKQSLLTANFLFEGSGHRQLDMVGKALKTIGQTGSADKIRREFAQMQAKAIVKGSPLPLRPWDVKNLKLEELINQHIKRLGGEVEVKIQPENKPKTEEAIIPERKKRGRPRKILEPVILRGSEWVEEDSGKKKKEKGVKKRRKTYSENEPSENSIGKAGGGVLPAEHVTENRKVPEPAFARRSDSKIGKDVILEEVIKELTAHDSWSETDAFVYLNVLAHEKKPFLEKLPVEFVAPKIISDVLDDISKGRTTGIAPVEIKKDGTSLKADIPEQWTFSTISMPHVSPDAIARINYEPYMRFMRGDEPILPIGVVYDFLQENIKLPVNVSWMGEKSYMMMRTPQTVGITKESGKSQENFRNIWYTQTGLTPATNFLGKLVSYDGVSLFSERFNRRPATIEACKSHKVALYESDNQQEFIRIA